VVASFDGKARFVVENYGDSSLAAKFGVTRYPAFFVDELLVATPDDFGFFAKDATAPRGRYAPLRSAAAHARFQADLARMVQLVLDGETAAARAEAKPATDGSAKSFPSLPLHDLDDAEIGEEERAGRVVLVDFWATWCPPCRATLPWLGELSQRFGDELLIVTIAVESPDAAVRKVATDLDLPVSWVIATPEIVDAFGGVSAVPTLLLFDAEGRAAGSWHGAPPTLHASVEQAIAALRS